ncbi:MAG: ATP-binding cassette domain-containing protein [Deltaproteobacteria bacterium]|nr:ATP-binding cassette domain-containing protein [Deltaproteobacteria bacterium]
MTTPRLSLRGIAKRYGDLTALAPLDLDLPAGSIHGVLGENGAGKSTLVRLVAGAARAGDGTIAVDGVPLAPGDPRAARAAGVGVVHQHFALVGALSVAENLALGQPETTGAWLAPAALAAAARDLAAAHGLDVGDPSAPCGTLPVGMQARVEILRALSAAPRVLLLDEPTAVLTPHETADLFLTLRRLRDGGMLVVFVTHKLDEALALCDAVTVLREGKRVTTVAAREVTARELARLMVGAGGVAGPAPRTASPRETGALVARDVTTDAGRGRVALAAVDLTVAAGEICGVAGVDGNGQDELAGALAGVLPRRGTVVVHGTTLPAGDVRAAIAAGLALIPGDRRREALATGLTVWENAILAAPLLARFAAHGILDAARARAFAGDLVRAYRVAAPSLEHPIGALSGGNQQRIVIGRALATAPRVLVAVNPTRGLDIAATAHVHATLAAAAAAGAAVVIFSTDLDELAAVADRLWVLYRGRLAGPLPPIDRERIGAAMAGLA